MPEAINGARYACQKCMNGHRTKTCQHWKNENAKLAESVNLEEVAPGESPENIAVFAKTRSAGRPKATDLEKGKKGTTLYILLKTTVDGKQSCRAIGEIDIDAQGNKKVTRTCCSTSETRTPSPPCHSRSKSSSHPQTPSSEGKVDTKIGEIKYETTKEDSDHKCSCGSTCTCQFCPVHPNTKATQDVMRRVADQVQQRYRLRPEGEVEFRSPFQEVIPCGGGQLSGVNSQVYATDDETQLEAWRQQEDGTGNYITSIPMQIAFDYGIGSPTELQSPSEVNMHFEDSPDRDPTSAFGGYQSPGDLRQAFTMHSPHGSRSEMEFFLAQHQWVPQMSMSNGHSGIAQRMHSLPVGGQPFTAGPPHARTNSQPGFPGSMYSSDLYMQHNGTIPSGHLPKSATPGSFVMNPSHTLNQSSHLDNHTQVPSTFDSSNIMNASHGLPSQGGVGFYPHQPSNIENVNPTQNGITYSMDIDPTFSAASSIWSNHDLNNQFWQQTQHHPSPPGSTGQGPMPFPI